MAHKWHAGQRDWCQPVADQKGVHRSARQRVQNGLPHTSEATALINATVTAVAGVEVSEWRKISGATDFWRADADFLWLGRYAMALLVGAPREGGGRAERGRRPTAGFERSKCRRKKANSLSLSLSLSLIFITRVAPHCVNTLMILHAAHTLMTSAG